MSRFSSRRQPLEPSLARVHDERIDAGRDRGLGETIERFLRVLLVDAQSAFHGDRDRHGRLHRCDAIADEARLAHEAGAKSPILHAI